MKFVELDDRKDSYVREFSGGMKRRLEIARGLLHHPKIIFLDEPTLGLDPQTRNHMWQYLEKLNAEEGVTVFFTTHYMDEADRVAERIAIIDHGKIIATGSGEELKKQTGTETLEEAFLKLTGSEIREEGGRRRSRACACCAAAAQINNYMNAIYIMWLREIKRFVALQVAHRGLAWAAAPFLARFGYGLGAVFAAAGQGNYIDFLAPGIIGMSIIFTSIFNGMQVIWDRQFGFLKETLVAPVSRLAIMFGRTLGGATVAALQGCIVLFMTLFIGFHPVLVGARAARDTRHALHRHALLRARA